MNSHSHHLRTVPEASVISVLGPNGSFSHKAGDLIRNGRSDISIQDHSSMRTVRRSTKEGVYALLPRINYSSGPEPDNQTALFTESWRIRAQVLLRVQMCIGGKGEPGWEAVTDVHSKDVALRQCRELLDTKCPDAQWHEENSTVRGAELVDQYGDVSRIAIASKEALNRYNLNIWQEGASNAEIHGHDNVTDFILVSQAQPEEDTFNPDMRYHGMVLTPANRPGIMRDIDSILIDHGMDKESQPELPYGPGLYRFLILFKRIDENADIDGMLSELERLPAANGTYPLLKSLGSWDERVLDKDLQNPEFLL